MTSVIYIVLIQIHTPGRHGALIHNTSLGCWTGYALSGLFGGSFPEISTHIEDIA